MVGASWEDSAATGVNGNQADDDATESGAAYVFTRSGTTWSQEAYLKASNAGPFDRFGTGVDIAHDTIVVAAPGESSSATGVNGSQSDNNAVESGAAYVFTRSGTVWSQQAYLKASNTGAGDWFGGPIDSNWDVGFGCLAISGDTIVVGAIFEDSSATGVNGDQSDNGAPDSGAAYVFTRTGTTWSQQAYLKASNAESADWFGVGVAVAGDAVVLGSIYEASGATGVGGDQADNGTPESGAAYVFMRTGTAWSQQAYLKASNTETMDQFVVCAIEGDAIVVGALTEDSNATGIDGDEDDNSEPDSGAVYVFR